MGTAAALNGHPPDLRDARSPWEARLDVAGRVMVVLLYVPLVPRLLTDVVQAGRLTSIFLLLNVSLAVAFTVFRRRAVRVDRSWTSRLATATGTVAPLLFRPGGSAWLPNAVTGVLGLMGFLLILGGLTTLRRSFGLVPADRGLVAGGMYQVVRHPIYAGYLLVHLAFVAAHLSPWNAGVWLVTDGAMIVRLLREERVLAEDPAYGRYASLVRWRLAPGLF